MAAPDFSKPTAPGIHEYLLGGPDHVPADKVTGDEMEAACPGLAEAVRASRRFVLGAAGWAASILGIRQVIDLGCGYATGRAVHEEARACGEMVRAVYVDRDAMVASHVAAVYAGAEEVAVIQGDTADPAGVLGALAPLADLCEPAACIFGGTLSAMDAETAAAVVEAFAAALAPGSAVIISVIAYRDTALGARQAARLGAAGTWRNHTLADVQSFFEAGGLRVFGGRAGEVSCFPVVRAMRGAVGVLGGIGIVKESRE